MRTKRIVRLHETPAPAHTGSATAGFLVAVALFVLVAVVPVWLVTR